jgi:hypothetical protein
MPRQAWSPQNQAQAISRQEFEQLSSLIRQQRIQIQRLQLRRSRPFMTPPNIVYGVRQALTPDAGIPGWTRGASSLTYGSATCTKLDWDSTANEATVGDQVLIYSPVEQAIGGKTVVSYMPHGDDPSKFFAIVEACGGEVDAIFALADSNDVSSPASPDWAAVPFLFVMDASQPAADWSIVGGQTIQYLGTESRTARAIFKGNFATTGQNQVFEMRIAETVGAQFSAATTINQQTQSVDIQFIGVTLDPGATFEVQIRRISGAASPTQTTSGSLDISSF